MMRSLCNRLGCFVLINKQDYATLMKSTDGCCEICSVKRRLYVDHDHDMGNIRGLICADCKRGIALIGPYLTQVVNYLEDA